MSKFELSELQKLHEELTYSLDNVKKDNQNIVQPVMDALKKEVIHIYT